MVNVELIDEVNVLIRVWIVNGSGLISVDINFVVNEYFFFIEKLLIGVFCRVVIVDIKDELVKDELVDIILI